MTKKKLRLGVFVINAGHHASAWRQPDAYLGRSFAEYVEISQLAEAAKLDMVFFADSPSVRLEHKRAHGSPTYFGFQLPFEPLTLISALAAVTKNIGLVATGSTTYVEPYNLARMYASVDFLSNGRAAWNIVTTADPESARNYGLEDVPPHDGRYARAEEYVDVVRKLWDSWADDAVIADQQAALYTDPAKLYFRPHKGEYFKVGGPLNLPRPPQGHPVLIQAGASGVGRELAARVADVVFTVAPTLDDAAAFYRDLKAGAVRYGRSPDDILIMPGISPVVGASEAEALAKLDRLNELIDTETAVGAIQGFMPDVDLSGVPLDEPLRDLPPTEGNQSRRQVVLDIARRENLTFRQVARRMTGSRGHTQIYGTPAQIADKMQEYLECDAADGFNIMPPLFPTFFREFVEQVVPELQRRGIFRTEYEGGTLRENLGLKRPAAKPPAV
jgi:FMN-dependent oxidoreductase (nitrilotriacetate monooxygenase family)